MSNIFKEIKRHISQWIETEYWYRFRKIWYSWFDDYGEDATYKYKWKASRAGFHLACTWEGEKDILDMMRLKIEHMFWNLKNYGNVAYCYIRSDLVLKSGTDYDKSLLANRVLKNYNIRYENKDNFSYSQFHEEWWTDEECQAHSPKKTRKCIYHNYENRIPIGTSDNIEYFIVHSCYFDGYGWPEGWGIESKDRKVKNFYFPSCYRFSDIQKVLDEKDIKINLVEGLLNLGHTINLVPSEDLGKLSPELRKHVEGERQILVDLLTLRRYVKKLENLEDTDNKYYNMWKDIEDADEQRKKMKEAEDLFLSDRKNLYNQIFSLMVEKGMGWWD